MVDGLRVWRFALFAAFAMTIPYLLVAVLLGPEFPSILGGLIGLAIVIPVGTSRVSGSEGDDALGLRPS